VNTETEKDTKKKKKRTEEKVTYNRRFHGTGHIQRGKNVSVVDVELRRKVDRSLRQERKKKKRGDRREPSYAPGT